MNAELRPPRRLKHPQRHQRHRRRGYNQGTLIAWLDEQERILRMRGVPAELVQEFDPIHNLPEETPEVVEGRRTLEIKFDRFGGLNLESSIADQINRSLEERVRSRFKLEITSWIQLQNTEDGSMMDWFNRELGESPWFETLVAAREWVSRQEEARLANFDRPNTKWSYELTKSVYVKVILDRHPLFLGLGRLPDWLRNKHGVLSLDTYDDNRCLFRCIAVHRGATPKRNMRKTKELEKSFFTQRPGLRNRLTDKHLSLLEKHFKQGIAAYTVQPNGDFVLTHIPANYDQVGIPLLNMGLYDGHAFLITDLKQVAGTYTCGDCQARFDRADNLARHAANNCSRGQTKITCPNNRIKAPSSVYERAFYPEQTCSFIAIKWLEWEAKKRGIHIHHARCGHGGERQILGARVDGYHPESKTVFQFHGCLWHGCEKCYPEDRQGLVQQNTRQGKVISRLDDQKQPMSRKTAYERTLQRTQSLRKEGYRVVEKWEHEKPTPWANTHCPKVETETYPHAIVYDFESYQDTSKAVRPTSDLFFENEHVPISVSLADTLNPEPEYIVSRDPAELIRLFHQSLERRHTAIVADVVKEFSFSDTEGIPEKQCNELVKWFHQVPVLGFNSGHYDLKLIRQHFIPLLAQDPGTFAAEKNGRIMFINTPKFKFLDVLNYLGPGITYEKWVKTYGATLAKSWLPYEWFDSPDKLDFPGLPPYMAWYSKLKGEYVLTLKEYDDCHRIFKERGMQTFGDWLEYYNNLDVAPFLEALQKMKEFYTSLGIDILKDAVSLPGVSEKYILRKTLQPRWGYKPPELYAPNKEAYAMLKAAVVGGPSLVFTRKHVAGETRIRSHQYEDARVCRRILGYDANSLYPSTMMKEMPCGPGFVKSYDNPEAYARVFPQFLWTQEWFGFAEVDIEVPEELWPEFEEFPPLFINCGVPDSAVPQHMHDYLQQSGRKRFPEQKKLLGVMSAKKILLYAPLLAWYLNQGLKLTAVYRTIHYEPREIFSWFVNEVANNRRKGDAEKDKALLAEVFKLLGNSAYGKFIEAVERHTNTIYTRDEEEVDKSLRSARFKTLEEIGPAYKVELRKIKINIDRPFQVGIVVYQLAKLRMLQFYYEFLDFYLDRRDFELIQMDTDSMYFALSRERLEDAIRPGYETQFEEDKKRWLAWDKWSNREPGLFKLEKEGTHAIALCSKCYHIKDQATGQAKVSSKGVNKRQNEMRAERFERALAGDRDVVVNRGFRMRDGAMYTYEQRKLGLSAYYDKRWVLPDGIHTEPLEYHQ